MAAHKGPASLRPRCTRSGSSVATIPVYQSTVLTAGKEITNSMKTKVLKAIIWLRSNLGTGILQFLLIHKLLNGSSCYWHYCLLTYTPLHLQMITNCLLCAKVCYRHTKISSYRLYIKHIQWYFPLHLHILCKILPKNWWSTKYTKILKWFYNHMCFLMSLQLITSNEPFTTVLAWIWLFTRV
jgi:hypothetical protein